MPRVSVPPTPRFCRLSEGSGADRQGGERRQDEFSHRFTSSMLCRLIVQRGGMANSLVHRGHATALNIAFRSAVRPADSLHESRFFQLSLRHVSARRSLSPP